MKTIPNEAKPIPIEDYDYSITPDGRVFNNKTGHEKSHNLWYGYHRVKLDNGSNMQKMIRVHRYVAIVFVENDDPENKTDVHHIDGDKNNNHMNNLEWVNKSEHCTEAGVKSGKSRRKMTCK